MDADVSDCRPSSSHVSAYFPHLRLRHGHIRFVFQLNDPLSLEMISGGSWTTHLYINKKHGNSHTSDGSVQGVRSPDSAHRHESTLSVTQTTRCLFFYLLFFFFPKPDKVFEEQIARRYFWLKFFHEILPHILINEMTLLRWIVYTSLSRTHISSLVLLEQLRWWKKVFTCRSYMALPIKGKN